MNQSEASKTTTYPVGITFGAFDPLHYGHIKLLQRAKQQCDHLIVCVSSNEYLKKHKGREERVNLLDRIDALESIKYVDQVGVQDIGGKKKAIQYWKPDVIFVGNDWTPETFTGEGLGLPVVYLPHTDGISSTQLVSKV